MPRCDGITIAHAAGRPRGDERHAMAALVATALVAAKWSGGDVAVFFRAIVAGENNERVAEQLMAGPTRIGRGRQPIHQPAQRHVIFVNVIMPRIHRFTAFGASGSGHRFGADHLVRRVRAVVGVGRVI